MKILGLNSPEIFLISVIILSILGPKRIEKGWLIFKKLLRFLLSEDEKLTFENRNLNINLESKVNEAKEEKTKKIKKEEV